jgi:hypothetical protein
MRISRVPGPSSTFSEESISTTSREIGLANTTVNQVPGCPQTPFNRLSLADAARMYEIASNGALPSGFVISATHDPFFNLMAGKAQFAAEGADYAHIWDTDLPNIIRQEAPAGTTAAQQASYRDTMDLAYKTGDYTVCQADCTHIQEYASISGWAKIPYCASNGTVFNEFTFGLFFAASPDNGWFAGKTTAAGSAFTAAKVELLREQNLAVS